MKKHLLLILGFLFLFSGISSAGLSSNIFEFGDEIEITGDGFGEYGLYSNICFGNNEQCLQ